MPNDLLGTRKRNAILDLLGLGDAPDVNAAVRRGGAAVLNRPLGSQNALWRPTLGGAINTAVEMAPGTGDAIAVQEFNRANQVGDLLGATLNAASLVPGIGDAAVGVKSLLGAKAGATMMPGLLGMTAFHGSPHDFDAFKWDKIGTGEGNQMYGYGLYFAENPEVADDYRRSLSGIGGGTAKYDDGLSSNSLDVWLNSQRRLIEKRKRDYATNPEPWIAQDIAKLEQELASVDSQSGRLYTVDIPDSAIDKMLDWDKRLSEQPEAVRKALADATERLRSQDKYHAQVVDGAIRGDAVGGAIYKSFQEGFSKGYGDYGSKEASDWLRSLGIPGIKYLDGGSRGAGEGTRNFVLFDESLVKILKKE